MSLSEEKSRKKMLLGADGNALVNLVVVIAVAFVLLKFVLVIYQLGGLNVAAYEPNVFNWFAMPASLENALATVGTDRPDSVDALLMEITG